MAPKYSHKILLVILVSFICLSANRVIAQNQAKPLVLQEMTWTDVRDYLKASDMVIIPLGSTEQHGPHLPLGTDYYLALEKTKLISARTGVVVAPVLMAGYSIYHSGFPGTLSLKPETMEEVLYETAEMLVKYGFRRIMLFNSHGGNNIKQEGIVYRINQTTVPRPSPLDTGARFQKLRSRNSSIGMPALKKLPRCSFLSPNWFVWSEPRSPLFISLPRWMNFGNWARKTPSL